ncbi:MAG: hypothetical protein ACOYMB_02410 [Patescibacteria group bacterium]
MKKFVIASLAVCAVALSGCTLGQAQPVEKTDLSNLENQVGGISTDIKAIREALEKQAAQTSAADTSTVPFSFTAYQKMGFNMTLPVGGSLTERASMVADYSVTNFYYSDEKNTDVFAISVFTPVQWNKIQAEAGPKPVKLGVSDNGENYIYGISYSQSVSSAYVKPIIDSFKIEHGRS